jgi:hypothetical protein
MKAYSGWESTVDTYLIYICCKPFFPSCRYNSGDFLHGGKVNFVVHLSWRPGGRQMGEGERRKHSTVDLFGWHAIPSNNGWPPDSKLGDASPNRGSITMSHMPTPTGSLNFYWLWLLLLLASASTSTQTTSTSTISLLLLLLLYILDLSVASDEGGCGCKCVGHTERGALREDEGGGV